MARTAKYAGGTTPIQKRIQRATGQSRGQAGLFARTKRDAFNGFRRKSNGGIIKIQTRY